MFALCSKALVNEINVCVFEDFRSLDFKYFLLLLLKNFPIEDFRLRVVLRLGSTKLVFANQGKFFEKRTQCGLRMRFPHPFSALRCVAFSK